MTEPQTVPLSCLTLDVDLQPREAIDRELIEQYAVLVGDGVAMPPVVAFRDRAGKHWLADGWHRFYAHKAEGRSEIAADVRTGERADAQRYSLGANATHGRQRSVGTLARAYQLAVKNGFADAADADAIGGLLNVSQSTAYALTEAAREERKHAARSLAIAMRATGMTQAAIAERLSAAGMDADQTTVGDWLREISGGGKSPKPPAVATQAELDRAAAGSGSLAAGPGLRLIGGVWAFGAAALELAPGQDAGGGPHCPGTGFCDLPAEIASDGARSGDGASELHLRAAALE